MSHPSLPFVSCFSLLPGSPLSQGARRLMLGEGSQTPRAVLGTALSQQCRPALLSVLSGCSCTGSRNLSDTSRQIKVWGQQEQRDNPGQSLGLEPAPAMSQTPLPGLLGGGCYLYFAAALAFPVQRPSNIPCPLLPCWSSPCPALVLFQDPKSQKLTASLPPASPIIFFFPILVALS